MTLRPPFRALVALLIALRLLLPAGYMPQAEGGELRFVMCSGAVQLPAGDSSPDGHQDTASKCPFAHAAFKAPPPQPIAVAEVTRLAVRLPADITVAPSAAFGPPRSATARAPPSPS